MTTSILRILTIITLFFIGLIGLCSEPVNGATGYLGLLLLAKSVAAVCLGILCYLLPRWSKSDPLISGYIDWCNRSLG